MFNGATPTRVETYRDRFGEPCAMADAWSSVITSESLWTPRAQDDAIALTVYESRLCPGGCGQLAADVHVDVDATDHSVACDVGAVRCVACASLAIASRDQHQKALEASQRDKAWAPGQPKPEDGLLYSVTPVEPGEE